MEKFIEEVWSSVQFVVSSQNFRARLRLRACVDVQLLIDSIYTVPQWHSHLHSPACTHAHTHARTHVNTDGMCTPIHTYTRAHALTLHTHTRTSTTRAPTQEVLPIWPKGQMALADLMAIVRPVLQVCVCVCVCVCMYIDRFVRVCEFRLHV